MKKQVLKIKSGLSIGILMLGINQLNAQCPTPTGVTAAPSVICTGATTSLNATATGAAINWYTAAVGGTAIGSTASGANFPVSPTITTTYYAESFVTATSFTFNFTGSAQTYTVPAGVTTLSVDVYGAQGGLGYNVPLVTPGLGGRVQAVMSVTPGEVLNIWVGGQGGPGGTTIGGTAGFNGGGVGGGWSGGRSGGGGGGASDIRQGGNALTNRIVVGAGGGATGVNFAAGNAGGNGGGLIGANGLTGTYLGAGATQTAGGAPNGTLGNGGNAPNGQTGGGGGGGYYGGGSSAWEGGGGGSSYAAPTCSGVVHSGGNWPGNGRIVILGSTVTCTSAQRTPVTVTVAPNPTITVNSGAICNGNSFVITPSGASTYSISGGTATVSPLVNSSYTVTGTGIGGCAATNTVVSNVTVNANPTITVNSGAVCAGTNFTLVPNGGTTYTYSGGSAIVTPTANTTYTVTGANALSCTNTAVSTITVNANPVITVNSGSICAGGSFTMVPSGATTYTYSSGSAVVTPTATSAYSVTGTGTNGCVGNTISNVTVNANPVVTVNSGSICAGGNFTIVPSGAATYTYSGGSAVVTPTATSAYSVAGTGTNGCVSNANAISNVTVTPLPNVLVASSPTLICAGQAATLTANGATSYVWNTTSTLTAIVVSPTLTTSYTVTGSSNGCSKTATVSQNVSACTGINSFVSTTSEINIFPNPSTGILNIDLTSVSSENINVQIVNSIGAVVLSSTAKSHETKTVSIQNLANGIYFVKVLEGNKVISIRKVVKD